jgi:hypothetical protein
MQRRSVGLAGVVTVLVVACASSSSSSGGSAPSSSSSRSSGGADAGAGLTCDGSTLDCNGDATDGCEVHPRADPKNCGACGKDCLGGACTDGTCGPARIITHDFSKSHVVLAADDEHLYFSTEYRFPGMPDTAVAKVPLAGGSVSSVVESPGHAVTAVTAMAVDSDSVVFKGIYDLHVAPKRGGVSKPLLAPTGNPDTTTYVSDYPFIAMRDGKVYFRTRRNDDDAGALARMPKAGGAVETLATDSGIASFVMDATSISRASTRSSPTSVQDAALEGELSHARVRDADGPAAAEVDARHRPRGERGRGEREDRARVDRPRVGRRGVGAGRRAIALRVRLRSVGRGRRSRPSGPTKSGFGPSRD